jgi:hypothetical protein
VRTRYEQPITVNGDQFFPGEGPLNVKDSGLLDRMSPLQRAKMEVTRVESGLLFALLLLTVAEFCRVLLRAGCAQEGVLTPATPPVALRPPPPPRSPPPSSPHPYLLPMLTPPRAVVPSARQHPGAQSPAAAQPPHRQQPELPARADRGQEAEGADVQEEPRPVNVHRLQPLGGSGPSLAECLL